MNYSYFCTNYEKVLFHSAQHAVLLRCAVSVVVLEGETQYGTEFARHRQHPDANRFA